jgi:hypothetical protein
VAASTVLAQHLMRVSQKLVQMRLDDVDRDGQLKGLVLVYGNISKSDHAFHMVCQLGVKPARIGKQSKDVS